MERNNKIIVSLGLVLYLLCCGISKAQHIKFGYIYDQLEKRDTIVVNTVERNPAKVRLINNENMSHFLSYLSFLSNEGYKYKIRIYFFAVGTAEYVEKLSEHVKEDLEFYVNTLQRKNLESIEASAVSFHQKIICDLNKHELGCTPDNIRIEIVLSDKEEKERHCSKISDKLKENDNK